ncbi:hypothetical protein [uncultured Thermomonospora sp.]|nr:hypothetical protein [uncultured Thermomonospora sp.]
MIDRSWPRDDERDERDRDADAPEQRQQRTLRDRQIRRPGRDRSR